MSAKRKDPTDGRRETSEFVRRAANQGAAGRTAVPHASLKRRAMGMMKQPLRTDLFRPAAQPHDIEQTFVVRTWNFVEGDSPSQSAAVAAELAAKALSRPAPEEPKRAEPQVDHAADNIIEDDDLELPQARPRESGEALDLPDLDEYDGSDLFDQEDPDMAAEPVIPTGERTELPSALRNRRNYYENSDQRKGSGLLGGIIPGSGRPAAKPGPKRR